MLYKMNKSKSLSLKSKRIKLTKKVSRKYMRRVSMMRNMMKRRRSFMRKRKY
jgi:hypothetical protein